MSLGKKTTSATLTLVPYIILKFLLKSKTFQAKAKIKTLHHP